MKVLKKYYSLIVIKILILLSSISFGYEIKVLEIDTGIDYRHDLIKSHINQLDLLPNRDEYIDDDGHGTHVAASILKGTCEQVKLYACRWYVNHKSDHEKYMHCLDRASTEGYDFINFSGGGENFDQEEMDKFQKLSTIKVTIVVAAGNMDPMTHKVYNLGSPCYGYFPACLPFTNIVVVGNLRQDDSINESSNYGMPGMVWEMGTTVWSAVPDNKMTYMTGTSMAAAAHTNRLLKERCKEINK